MATSWFQGKGGQSKDGEKARFLPKVKGIWRVWMWKVRFRYTVKQRELNKFQEGDGWCIYLDVFFLSWWWRHCFVWLRAEGANGLIIQGLVSVMAYDFKYNMPPCAEVVVLYGTSLGSATMCNPPQIRGQLGGQVGGVGWSSRMSKISHSTRPLVG